MGEGSPGKDGSKAIASQDNPEAPLTLQVVHQSECSVRGSNAMNSCVEESGLAFVEARQDGTLVVLCGIPGAATSPEILVVLGSLRHPHQQLWQRSSSLL